TAHLFICLFRRLQSASHSESCNPQLGLILTLRADFYGHAISHRDFSDALQQGIYNSSPMNPEELRAVIEQPAAKMKVELESGLADKLIDELGNQAGSLPLLEFTLSLLWEKHDKWYLTHQAYKEIGGLKQALAKYAGDVINPLSAADKQKAERIFIQLISPGEGTEDTKRKATRREVGEDNWDLVEFLANHRLVVTGWDESSQQETVEIVHEALIRHWNLLRRWIDENREKLIQKRKLEAAAVEWRDKGKSKDYLLTRKHLTNAKIFQQEKTENLGLSELTGEFIQASLKQKRVGLLQTSSILIIPILIAVGIVVPYQRQQSYNQALENISPANIIGREQGIRVGLELLTEGCWAKRELTWLSKYLSNLLFGKCHRFLKTNLRTANLSRANLSGADFSSTDFSGADLNGANLINANLIDANLRGAYLRDAKLNNADLNGANLINANLIDANLRGTKLNHSLYSKQTNFPENFNPVNRKMYLITPGVNLSGANLSNADLSSAKLSGANFGDADLRYANFNNADLNNADLRTANLSGANLSKVKLNNANLSFNDLSSVNLSFSDLSSANLSGANLTEAKVVAADLGDANLSGAKLNNANLSGANLSNTNLTKAKASGADLGSSYLNNTNLIGADLSNADLGNADLSIANLNGADLRGAKLRGAKLNNTVLSDTDLNNADLRNTDLSGADLSNTDLSGADLRYAKLRGAKLSGADLNGVKFWDKAWGETRNITPKQIKKAKNWDKAIYSPEFRKQLGLPSKK
ncbi:MAG: pentapeptide repeat-containing protein, partial [Rivularia sp. (in: cyanobacteria)]